MSVPHELVIETTAGDTVPIIFEFDASVDGGAFVFTHSQWGTISLTGSGYRVSVPVTETRTAAAPSTYQWTLVINDGVEGSEQTVARGIHRHGAR